MTGIVPRRAVERCEALAKLFALRRWLRAYRAIMALDISEAAEMLRELYPNEKLRRAAARVVARALATAPNPFIKIGKAPTARPPIGRWVEPFFPRSKP